MAAGLELSIRLDDATAALLARIESAHVLTRILGKLISMEDKMVTMQEALGKVTQAVNELGAVVESTAAAVDALIAKVQAAGGDPAAVETLAAQVAALKTALEGKVAQATASLG